jgi:hypothetical protein
MQTLLDLLRGELNQPNLTADEQMTVLDLAAEENILPWIASRLRAQANPDAPAVNARLSAIERDARISAFIWTQTLRSTLAEFHRRGIPVISLKGPWLAQRLYGDTALRLYSDLDLLVRRADFARAETLLSGLGFTPAARRDDYARTWTRDSITLELHDDVENPLAFDFVIAAAWERAQPAEFEGVPAKLLAPSDELRFLCLHGARHRFERLSHILDLVLAFRHLTLPQPGKPDRMLALGSMIAAQLDPRLTEVAACYTATPDRGNLAQTAACLWQERMRAPSPKLDWRAKHSFLLSIERRGWDRISARARYFRILSTRLIAEDFLFAKHFHLHRTWQVWLLRPLRLLLHARQPWPDVT